MAQENVDLFTDKETCPGFSSNEGDHMIMVAPRLVSFNNNKMNFKINIAFVAILYR